MKGSSSCSRVDKYDEDDDNNDDDDKDVDDDEDDEVLFACAGLKAACVCRHVRLFDYHGGPFIPEERGEEDKGR